MNLAFAILNLGVGIGFLVWHSLDPETTRGKIGGMSLGWVALVLGAYNAARWWSERAYRASRAAERALEEQRRPHARRIEPEPDSPFRFDDTKPTSGEV